MVMKSFFRNQFVWFISGMLVISLISCSTPIGKFFSASKKVEETKKEIVKNKSQIIEKAKTYAWSTDYILELNNQTNKYTELAKDFSRKTTETLGAPQMDEIIQMKEIISNLLSDQEKLIIKGQKALKEKDLELAEIQSNIKDLQKTLEIKEEKLQVVNQENAKYANIIVKAKRWFWWGIWLFIVLFVINTIAHALPPPYNAIGYIIGMPFGLFIKGVRALIPSATKFAGVVASKTYEETQKALNNVVVSIEEAKTKIDAKNEATGVKSFGLTQLNTELNKNTDNSDKIVITQVKQALGYI
jgi:hypothetical protein